MLNPNSNKYVDVWVSLDVSSSEKAANLADSTYSLINALV